MTDTEIIDFLEENLLSLTHVRMTSSVYMDGTCMFLQAINPKEGPHTIRVRGTSIRDAINKYKEQQKQ